MLYVLECLLGFHLNAFVYFNLYLRLLFSVPFAMVFILLSTEMKIIFLSIFISAAHYAGS